MDLREIFSSLETSPVIPRISSKGETIDGDSNVSHSITLSHDGTTISTATSTMKVDVLEDAEISSMLKRHVHSHDRPPFETNTFENFIREAEKDCEKLREEMKRLAESIEGACLQLAEKLCLLETKQRAIRTCRWVISPVCHVPREVLSIIFTYCLPSRGVPYHSSKTAPLLLCQICSSWRTIAQSLPELWSSLSVRFTTSEDQVNLQVGNPTINIIHKWLSCTAPLKFLLQLDLWGLQWGDQAVHSFADLLLANAECFRDLELTLPSMAVLRYLLGYPAGNYEFKFLDSFRLKVHGELKNPFPASYFIELPALRKLKFDTTYTSRVLCAFHVPWKQITHLNFWDLTERLHHEYFINIIENCPNLEEASGFLNCCFSVSWNWRRPLTHLPYLRTLVLDIQQNASTSFSLFGSLQTPSLRQLFIKSVQ
ncbi:hypothetical protein BDQ17DRAFT_747078 [Cyathus striatus]|nr:hypothetical protein BDQ17DRAFT_747078 [Cyathus striatus]